MWWDDEKTLYLITPEEYEALPDGFELKCIDGTTAIKGRDYIDQDTRMGKIAYGVPDPLALTPIHNERRNA